MCVSRHTFLRRANRRLPALKSCACLLLFLSVALTAVAAEWVRFEGVTDANLTTELRAACGLAKMTDTKTFTDAWLQRKAENQCAGLLDVLHGAGYHDASVVAEVGRDRDRRTVLFRIQTGAVYNFDKPDLAFITSVEPAVAAAIWEKLSVKNGAPAHAADVVDSEKRMLSQLRDAGYPFAKLSDRKVLVDRGARCVHVAYEISPGDACRFGAVVVDGLVQVSESVVMAELPWKQGGAYSHKSVEKARSRLLKTNLFTMVTIEPWPGDSPGEASIHIHVVERKPRSVALGVQYRTEEGPGLHAMWEHRNLRGIGHRLELSGDFSAIDQAFSAKYVMPRFMNPDQTLSLGLKASNDTPDAYDSRAVDSTLWLERKYGETFTAGAGLSMRYSHVRQQNSFDDFVLGSTPVQAVWDTRNDRLNPTSGLRALVREEPYADLAGSGSLFLKSDWSLSGMQALSGGDDWVLAGRLRLGMIAGENLGQVPADIRFYAGGGGSIRGFGYQKAGALDKDNNPVGGRSLAEWTIELRKKITERIGIAAFVDGGRAFSGDIPDLSQPIYWGGGIGMRYFTPIGPIRFDIAAPLNGRNHVDAAVQFYVSVGQAF